MHEQQNRGLMYEINRKKRKRQIEKQKIENARDNSKKKDTN